MRGQKGLNSSDPPPGSPQSLLGFKCSTSSDLSSAGPPSPPGSAPAAPSPPPHSRWRWRPGNPPWPERSSRTTPAGRAAWARPPPGTCAGPSSPAGRSWPEPTGSPAATPRTATASVWSWWRWSPAAALSDRLRGNRVVIGPINCRTRAKLRKKHDKNQTRW